mgnify:CR=1 FL=1
MTAGPSRKNLFLPGAVSLGVLLLAGALWLARGDLSSLPAYGAVPDFALTDALGRAVGRKDLAGKVWVADLIFTRCTDTCPLQSAEMARLQKEFAGAKDLRLVSITTDPAYDTPAVLARYAARYQADLGTWLFLTGEEKDIARLAREGFRLAFATRGSKPEEPPVPPERVVALLREMGGNQRYVPEDTLELRCASASPIERMAQVQALVDRMRPPSEAALQTAGGS